MEPFDLESIPPEQLEQVLANIAKVKEQRAVENKLAHYVPYPKQAAFHEAGATHRERLFMCANRFGKTLGGSAELAFHLTGAYPTWWCGKRFDKPVRAWAAGVTSESTRDVLQQMLIGPPFREAEWGTGMIPKAAIANVATARGIPSRFSAVAAFFPLQRKRSQLSIAIFPAIGPASAVWILAGITRSPRSSLCTISIAMWST